MSDERMSTEQAGNQTTGRQAPAGPTGSQTGQGTMTSWLRRRFGLDPESREGAGARKGRPAGVATERILQLLARVRNTSERARVWKPDVGSLRPELVQQFSGAIARRHERLQLVGVRRRLVAPVDQWRDALELTLPTGARPDTGTGASPGKLKGPSIFSVGQPIPRMSPQVPTAGRPSSPSRVPSRPAGQAQHRRPPPGSRLFARVEEVAPAGRKPSAEEEAPPVQQEADLEPPELAGEPPLQDTEPSPGGERPSPSITEPAPPRAQPTIQRRAVDAGPPAPPRRQQDPSRSQPPPVEQTQALPLAGELGEPQAPPSEMPISLGPSEQKVVEGQAAEQLPLRPAPGAPSPAPQQERAAREPSPPRREQRALQQPDSAPPASADEQPSRGEPASPPRQQIPVQREEEETPSGPSRAPTPPAERVQPARPTARVEELATRPRPVEARPPSVAGREQPQAPRSKPVESAPVAERVQRQPLTQEPAADRQPPKSEDETIGSVREGAESGPEMVLHRPVAPPEAAGQETEKPEPVMEVALPRSTPGVQRQARGPAGRQAAPALSADGRRILARARSRARATLTKLAPARHRPPEAGPLPTGARVPDKATAAGPGILGQIQRQRRHRPASLTLYGRGPEVRIGPDSSLPVTRRIAGDRPHAESGPEQPGERPASAFPPGVRSLLSAVAGRSEKSVREGGLPLPSLPRPSAPRGTPVQRATGGTPARQGPPGGSFEPPWLPPPPPEEPSLPLARPPAPRPIGERATEQTAGTQGVVQRAPDGVVGTLQRERAVVQREPGEDDLYEEIDLSDLARRVYPVIKRLLSIERERTRGRSL